MAVLALISSGALTRRPSLGCYSRLGQAPAITSSNRVPTAGSRHLSERRSGVKTASGGSGGNSGGGSTGGGGEGSGEGGDHDGSGAPWTALLAGLVMGGGAMGYLKKGSTKSAIAGGSVGAILLCAAACMGSPSLAHLGYKLAFGTCLLLAAVMAKRASSSGKFMPSGMVASLSALYCIMFPLRYGKMLSL